MNEREYQPRIVDIELKKKMAVGAVLIEGAKWCGKTWTAEQQAQSVLFMNDPEKQDQNIALASNSPTLALSGATPRLIDEWQLVPKLWDAVRFEVDQRGKPAQFILTGSAVPADMSSVYHTGTGRIARLLMRPMSLFEAHVSSGEVSLKGLFETPDMISGSADLGLTELSFLVCRGGWPKTVKASNDDALTLAEAYFEGVVEGDISRVDGVRRNPDTARRILRSYARNLCQQVSLESIRKDVGAGDGVPVGIDTIYDYIDAFRKIYLIEDCGAWNPNLRSRAAIRTSDTRYFVDPSIACNALGVSPDDLINDLKTFGFIFENMCMRDLRIYTEASGGVVSHYRDSNGLECDAVVHLRNGRYGLVQIKLGSDDVSIANAVQKLRTLADNIDEDKMGAPTFMMVLCGNCPYAYRREDGIYVVPIGCLGV